MQNTKNYKTMGICAAIFFVYMPNMYAECMHFAHVHSVCMLHMCVVHIIFMQFAHMLYRKATIISGY